MSTPVANPAHVFPRTADIPEAMRQPYYANGARYLIAGKVEAWTGPCQEVTSPLCVDDGAGPAPAKVGHYPLMTSEKAMEALEAACKAYGRGCGEWPTMSVGDRIRHLESFIPRMQAVRDEVVRLLMWEIGKTLPDSRKEFDRTVDYIRDNHPSAQGARSHQVHGSRSSRALSPRFAAARWACVLCMGPQNYSLNETFTTLIPALIMGTR
jgi:glyceraldehyde-3-phosphate dehydrogenase (NADP+)